MGLPCHDGEVEGVVVEDDAVLVLGIQRLQSRNLERVELEKTQKKKKSSKHALPEEPPDATSAGTMVPHAPLEPLALEGEQEAPLPEGWSEALDPDGNLYYLSTSGETSWDRPTEAASDTAWGEGWDAEPAGEQNGYYDESGNWIDGYYDESGNWIQGFYDEYGNWNQGYYDENGEWIDTSAYVGGGYYDANYGDNGWGGGGYEGDDGFGETYGGYDYYGYEQADYQDGSNDVGYDAGYDYDNSYNDAEAEGALENYGYSDPSGEEAYEGGYDQTEPAGGENEVEDAYADAYADGGEPEELQGYNEGDEAGNYDEAGVEGDEFEGDLGEQAGEWQELVDENGNTYWYNESTGESQY